VPRRRRILIAQRKRDRACCGSGVFCEMYNYHDKIDKDIHHSQIPLKKHYEIDFPCPVPSFQKSHKHPVIASQKPHNIMRSIPHGN
jgi:hypothetical protein